MLAALSLALSACGSQPVPTPIGGIPTPPPASATASGSGSSLTPASPASTSSASPGGQAVDWPAYLGNLSRTASSDETILSTSSAPKLTPREIARTGGPIAASATIVAGVAYVGSWDGYEYAIDVATGNVRWKTNLGLTVNDKCQPQTAGVTSSAAVESGVVYVGGGDAYWYALDAASGAVRWRVPTGDNSAAGGHYNWSSPLIWNGSAYIGIASDCDVPTVRGELLRVDLSSHKVVATFGAVPKGETGGGIWTSPAVDPATKTIFVTDGNHTLQSGQPYAEAILALDATTLAVRSSWQIPAKASISDGDWGTSPILFADASGRSLVAAANKDGVVYAFLRSNLAAGPVWTRRIANGGQCAPCGDGVVSSMAFGAGRLYAAGGTTAVGGTPAKGAVRALDPATGAVIWEKGLDDAVIGALAHDNGLVVAAAGATLDVFDASNGTVLYSHALPAPMFAPPSISGGTIYIGSLGFGLWGFTAS